MSRKILVTGGVGFIGSNLVKALFKKGFKVTSLDNYSTGSKSKEIEGVEYQNLDISEINSINNNFEICFHLAAQSRVQPSFELPEESLESMQWELHLYWSGLEEKH